MFSQRERSYVIWGRGSWDKLAKINIAGLHPCKKKKFNELYGQFKEYHYSRGFLKDSVYKKLIKPYTTAQLSNIFNRSSARVCDVVIELKKEGKINNFRVGSKSYWVRLDKNIIVISSLKQKYLKLLTSHSKTIEFAKTMQVCWKSAHRRLTELRKLGLVSYESGKWVKKPQEKEVIVRSL